MDLSVQLNVSVRQLDIQVQEPRGEVSKKEKIGDRQRDAR